MNSSLVPISYPELLYVRIDELGIRGILLKLLEYLYDVFEIFSESVPEKFPSLRQDYNTFIEYPCDLSKMLRRIKNLSPIKYKYVGQVIRDFELIARNCELFNSKKSQYLAGAQRLREYYFYILPKMLEQVNILVRGRYEDMLYELSVGFPLNSTCCVDGALIDPSSAFELPDEDSVTILYEHFKRMPKMWQEHLLHGLIAIYETRPDSKLSGQMLSIDLDELPEAYKWLRNQIIIYVLKMKSGRDPNVIKTWYEKAFWHFPEYRDDGYDSLDPFDELPPTQESESTEISLDTDSETSDEREISFRKRR